MFFMVLPRLISLTVMAEEDPQPQINGDEPSQVPLQQTGQQRRLQQGQTSSGQRRNDSRDHSRRHGGRRDHYRRDQRQPPRSNLPEKPGETAETIRDNDDEEEAEQDRPYPRGRRHHRGGRPPKKIIEEWASDPYCE
jgi:hypothetical protein